MARGPAAAQQHLAPDVERVLPVALVLAGNGQVDEEVSTAPRLAAPGRDAEPGRVGDADIGRLAGQAGQLRVTERKAGLQQHLPDARANPWHQDMAISGGAALLLASGSIQEPRDAGWVCEDSPRMYTVQAAGCAPMVRAFESGAICGQTWAEPWTARERSPGTRSARGSGSSSGHCGRVMAGRSPSPTRACSPRRRRPPGKKGSISPPKGEPVWRRSAPSGGGLFLAVALFVIGAWPPENDKSLSVKFVNWAADPGGKLPVLPPQLGYGVGDDPQAVEARDAQVRRYDELYNQGGWTRTRLELKVADDPLNASTERQLLLAVAAVAVFAVWQSGRRAT